MKHNLFRIGFVLCSSSIFLFGSASSVSASTVITEDTSVMYGHPVWTASSSPYILKKGIYIPYGSSLTIGPGVEVDVDPSIGWETAIFSDGTLNINGTRDKRVVLKSVSEIQIANATTSINYADIDLTNDIYAVNSVVDIASTNITHGNFGLRTINSKVNVTDSSFKNNRIGMSVEDPEIPVLMNASDRYGEAGGIGNALGDAVILKPLVATVSSSSFAGNTILALQNTTANGRVDARNNWWGSDVGPVTATSSMIKGVIDYDPWIKGEKLCCSSVVFIPGIESSRLYNLQPASASLGTTTHQLWEPFRNSDVAKLYLDSLGSSTDSSIYVGGLLGSAYGIKSIYSSFMNFLDTLKNGGSIAEWKAFPYDWRKSIPEVVLGNEQRATTTESLINVVRAVASSSKTGKVTLVAHSNGGLVAKYLVKTLADRGLSDIIDQVVSVAVPFIGTPEAIPDLLHGYNQSIGHGLILKQSTARGLGINMPSAYSLLPSASYFARVLSPTIAFASTTEAGINNGTYSPTITSAAEQNSFITDTKNVRTQPVSSDLVTPIKGNSRLMASAESLHTILDAFTWPSSLMNWSILGWNVPTTKALQYYNKSSCTLSWTGYHCSIQPAFVASTTAMGDGTVVAPSASYASESIISADLKKISHDEGWNINHATILESSTTEKIIGDIITGKISTSSALTLSGMSRGEPDYSKEPSYIVVSTDANVNLSAYDQAGRHTGMIDPPAGVTDDVVTAYEERIPGSTFTQAISGSGNSIHIPDDAGRYTIVAEGTGVGTFNLDVQRIQGDRVIDQTAFDAVPVLPSSVATTTIMIPSATEISTPLASSTLPLTLDISGTGSSTLAITSGTTPDPIKYFEVLKNGLRESCGSTTRMRNIWNRIDRIEDKIRSHKKFTDDKEHGREYQSVYIRHDKNRGFSSHEKDTIMDTVERFISQFE